MSKLEKYKEALESHAKWLRTVQRQGERLVVSDEDFRNVDLSGMDLRSARFRNCNFQDANLDGCDLAHCDFGLSNFRNASLKGANLVGANLSHVVFIHADLSGAKLQNAKLSFTIGDGKRIKTILVHPDLPISYTSDVVQFGCKAKPLDAWVEMRNGEVAGQHQGALEIAEMMRDVDIVDFMCCCPAEDENGNA